MDEMSSKQRAIYEFIQRYTQEHGRPPTNREIGKAVGIESTGHVDYHLSVLEKKGYIIREDRKSRAIRITQQGLPMKGHIAAGQPLEIYDAPERYIDLAKQVSNGKYLLEVRGKSMIEDCIDSGDYVLVDPDAAIEPGDVIVAVRRTGDASERGAATLKRFYKEKNRIELRPANSSMEPLYIDAEEWERDWEIQGKVKAVYRLFERPRK